ncbi:MAG: HEAT repeat domain-containing protein [Ruminococcaceae bacterium]|jgi:HEAT repeat protein|nr:HEAT repeat domain-containing protein [Oscillospiraceae bacterium]
MGKLEKIEKLITKGKSDKIIALTNDKKPEVHLAAIAALGKIGDDNALNTLVVLLRDTAADKRVAAVKALGKIASSDTRNSAAKTHLQYLKNSEKDAQVIQALEETLTLISQAG